MESLPIIGSSVTQLRALPLAVAGRKYNTPDGGLWSLDTADTTSTDNGAVTVVLPSGQRVKRLFNGVVDVTWFGAKADYNQTTNTGTDNTSAFQAAINYLIANNGGQLFVPKGKYLFLGTVYCKPTSEGMVLNITSGFDITANNFGAAINYGVTFIRNTPGTIFMTNLDESGNNVLGANNEWFAFSISGINVWGRTVAGGTFTANVVLVQTFRTRIVMKNMSAHSIAYLIYQTDTDASSNPNYYGHSIVDNIRIFQSTFSAFRVVGCESPSFTHIYFENPRAQCKFCLEVITGSAVNISNMIHGISGNHTLIAGGAFIYMTSVVGVSISTLHLESLKFESTLSLNFCQGVNIFAIHTKFFSNCTLRLNSCNAINIKSWHSIEDKAGGTFDIVSASSKRIVRESCSFNTYNLGVPATRSPLISITGGYGGSHGELVHARISYVGTSWVVRDFNDSVLADFTASFSNGVILSAPYNLPMIVNVSKRFRIVSATALYGYMPIVSNSQGTGELRIRFANDAGTIISTPDENMDFDIVIAPR